MTSPHPVETVPASNISRRLLLRTGAVLTAAGTLTASLSRSAVAKPVEFLRRRRAVLAAAERARRRVVPGWKTANGFLAETGADAGGEVWTRQVSGTPVSVALRDGAPRTLLEYVIRRFHYEVAELSENKVTGFVAEAPRRGVWSNQASGTAVRLLPGHYPIGADDGLFKHQVRVVRDILEQCDGQVAWGGDLRPPCEGYFYVKSKPDNERLLRASKARRGREAAAAGRAAARPLGA